jgi:hypothetical protein
MTDAWTAQYLGNAPRTVDGKTLFAWSRAKYAVADAPELDLTPPEIRVLENRTDGKKRTIRLRVRSPRGGSESFVLVAGEGAEAGRAFFQEYRIGVPTEGYEVAFTAPDDGKSFTVTVDDYLHGLPNLPGKGVPTRPAYLMQTTNHPETDVTLARTRLTLPPPETKNDSDAEDALLPPIPQISELIMNL